LGREEETYSLIRRGFGKLEGTGKEERKMFFLLRKRRGGGCSSLFEERRFYGGKEKGGTMADCRKKLLIRQKGEVTSKIYSDGKKEEVEGSVRRRRRTELGEGEEDIRHIY